MPLDKDIKKVAEIKGIQPPQQSAYQKYLATLKKAKAQKKAQETQSYYEKKFPDLVGPKKKPTTYTVKKDDTFSSIASQYDTDQKSVIQSSGIKNLRAGQVIKMPETLGPPAPLAPPTTPAEAQARRVQGEDAARLAGVGKAPPSLKPYKFEEPDYLAGGPTSLVPKTFDDKLDNVVNRALYFMDTVLAPRNAETRSFPELLEEGIAGPFTFDRMEQFKELGPVLGPAAGPLGIPGVGGDLGGERALASKGYEKTSDMENKSVGDNIHYNGYIIPREEFGDYLKNRPVPDFDETDPYWEKKIFHQGTLKSLESLMWGLREDRRDWMVAVITPEMLNYYNPTRDWADLMINVLNYRWDSEVGAWIKQEEDDRYHVGGGGGGAGYGGGWGGAAGGGGGRGTGQYIRAGDPTQIGRRGGRVQVGGSSQIHWRI